MPQFVVSGPAAADLGEIYVWIARDDQSAAARMLEELRSAMRRLAQHPGLGMSVATWLMRR
jgi:plasmid stabilization system protein ParE